MMAVVVALSGLITVVVIARVFGLDKDWLQVLRPAG